MQGYCTFWTGQLSLATKWIAPIPNAHSPQSFPRANTYELTGKLFQHPPSHPGTFQLGQPLRDSPYPGVKLFVKATYINIQHAVQQQIHFVGCLVGQVL